MPQAKHAQGIILFTRNRYVYPKYPGGRSKPPPTRTMYLVIMEPDRRLPALFRQPRLLAMPGNPDRRLYGYLGETLFHPQTAGPYWLRETRITVNGAASPEIGLETVRHIPARLRRPLTEYRNWLKYRLELLWPSLIRMDWTLQN